MDTQTLEAQKVEVTPQTAVVIRPEQHVSLFGASEPVAIIEKATSVATALKGVLQAQHLISKIQGKEYPRCEAWTLLGTMLGVFPVLAWSKPVEDGWEARVEAKTRDGAIVGAAEAQCLRTERNWSNRDDFAIRSMAQTRATAKALRMPLGFVMTLAGYEATLAEEMTFEKAPAPTRNSNTRGLNTLDQSAKSASVPGASQQGSSPGSKKPATQLTPTEEAPKGQSDNTTSSAPPGARTAKPVGIAPTIKHRDRMLDILINGDKKSKTPTPTYPQEDLLTYARGKSILMPSESGEGLGDWPLRFVPVDEAQMRMLQADLKDFFEGAGTDRPPFTNPEPGEVEKPKVNGKPKEDEAWKLFPVPFGPDKGVPLGQLAKSNPKKVYGFWANFKCEPTFEGRNGPVRKKPEALANDKLFRIALDAAGAHMEFTKKGGDE